MKSARKDTAKPRGLRQRELFNRALKRPEVIIDPEAIGLMVREARERLGISQLELSQETMSGRKLVAEIEGSKANANLSDLLSIFSYLGLSLAVDITLDASFDHYR